MCISRCIPQKSARAAAWREDRPSPSSLELLAPDGSIDLSNSLVLSIPVYVLALAVASAAVRNGGVSASSAQEAEFEACLA